RSISIVLPAVAVAPDWPELAHSAQENPPPVSGAAVLTSIQPASEPADDQYNGASHPLPRGLSRGEFRHALIPKSFGWNESQYPKSPGSRPVRMGALFLSGHLYIECLLTALRGVATVEVRITCQCCRAKP